MNLISTRILLQRLWTVLSGQREFNSVIEDSMEPALSGAGFCINFIFLYKASNKYIEELSMDLGYG